MTHGEKVAEGAPFIRPQASGSELRPEGESASTCLLIVSLTLRNVSLPFREQQGQHQRWWRREWKLVLLLRCVVPSKCRSEVGGEGGSEELTGSTC